MKTILIIIVLGLLPSCTNHSQFENIKSISIKEANAPLSDIKKDILKKTANISNYTKLNLCFIDYMFKYPEKYKELLKLPNGFEKQYLTSDSDFRTICASRDLALEDIPPYISLNRNVKLVQHATKN